MLRDAKKLLKSFIACTIVCFVLVGCCGTETDNNNEGQTTLNETSDGTTDVTDSESKESTTEETTTEESTTEGPTTEVIPDDGQRDKLVAAAKHARDEYVATYEQLKGYEVIQECAAFYDFNLDGVPEFCTLEANATGVLSGYLYVYKDGKYIQQYNIVGYNGLKTYKDANGNCRSVEKGYDYVVNDNGEYCREYEVYIYDYKENALEYIGKYIENTNTKEIDCYYNNSNEKITKEQYEEILNGYLNGYKLVNNCGGKYEHVMDNPEEALFDAYVSYLKKIGK